MKTIITLIMTLGIIQSSYAGFWNQNKEAVTVGTIAAVYGMTSSVEESKMQNAVIYGLGAGLLTYGIKAYFQRDLDKGHRKEISEYKKVIKLQMLANQQNRADGQDVGIGVRVRTVQPGKRLPNGEIIGETVREGTRRGELPLRRWGP